MINAIYCGKINKNFEPGIQYMLTSKLSTNKLRLKESHYVEIPVLSITDVATYETIIYTSLEQFLNEWKIVKEEDSSCNK